MMGSPKNLVEFAIGFSLTEGLIENIHEIYDIEIIDHITSYEIQLTISQKTFNQLKIKRRSMLGRTGCGVCGIESIELLDLSPQPILNPLVELPITTQHIKQITTDLSMHQTISNQTGGAHAAAWCSFNGQINNTFEDVGRHNALDKLIGYLAKNKIDFNTGFVFMSSRGSYELVRKVARMNIKLLATISAPTSLAIDIAHKAQVKLICFCRKNGFVEY